MYNDGAMRLILFDINGTLMLTGGAGMRAFYRALQDVFGLTVTGRVVNPDGKTRPIELRASVARAEQPCSRNLQR
jgi:phosphoglycolate phosphatase-like HAD superfamily hydrolase